jgi:hypothetical protein
MTHKSRKNIKKFHVLSAGCSLLGAEGFFCNLYVLFGEQGTGELFALSYLPYIPDSFF